MTCESVNAEIALKLHNELFDTFATLSKILGPFNPECVVEQERLASFCDTLRYVTDPKAKVPHYKHHIQHLQKKIAEVQTPQVQAPVVSQAQSRITAPPS